MRNRNQWVINFAALVAVFVFAWFIVEGVTSPAPGLTVGSSDIQSRISQDYVDKTVAGNKPEVKWKASGLENSSANVVTSIVVDYRMFDTFGEILVLFSAAAGVSLLMKKRKKSVKTPASPLVMTAIPIIMVFTVLIGLYITTHGHLSPGGGFPGGAVIASAFLLQYLVFKDRPSAKLLKVVEGLAGLGIVAFGVVGFFQKGSLFAHFLPQGLMGAALSTYSTMVIYSLIGAKVAAELSALTLDFVGD